MNEFINSSLKGRNRFGLYISVILLVIFANVIGSIPGAWAMNQWKEYPNKLPEYFVTGLMLLGFVASLIVLWYSVKFIHKRDPATLVSPLASINWRRIFLSGFIWFLCSMVVEFITYLIKPDFYLNSFNLKNWLPALLIGLLLIPLQSWFEEMFFRGYLLQAIGLWNVGAAVIITSTLFGLAHGLNDEVKAAGGLEIAMIYYIGFGLFAALLAITDKTLELAMGIHAANNIYAFLVVGYPSSSLPTASIWITARLSFPLMIVQWLFVIGLYLATTKLTNLRK